MEIAWGAGTDRGRVRNHNEDAYLAHPPVFVVADGMGGHAAGETASAAVIDQFTQACPGEVTPEWIVERLRLANRQIRSGAGGGTTAAGAALVERAGEPYWLVFNIGDSRVYRFRGADLQQVSVDHSLVQQMVDAGRLSAERARSHPERHIITKAVGTPEEPRPDFWWVPRHPGDRLLVCSDGVTGELDDAAIGNALRRPTPAQQVADHLIAAALAAGGRDNLTCVVIDALPAGSGPAPE